MIRRARLAAVLLVSLASAIGPRPALGAPASRVALIRFAGDELTRQAETLLGAELRAAGFEVVTVDRPAGADPRAAIEAVSARLQPIATMAIIPGVAPAAAEVWLSDRVTGKFVIRRLEADTTPATGASSDLALMAVELLRGSLLEITVASSATSTKPPADVARWVAQSEATRRPFALEGLGLAVGGAMMRTVAGFGPMYAPAVRVSYGSPRGLTGRIGFIGPGSTISVRQDEGAARIRQELLIADALLAFRPGALVQPFALAGAGISRVRADGTGASSLFPALSGARWGAVGDLAGGAILRLGRRAAFVADAHLLVSPPVRVTIAAAEAARIGGTSLLVSATLAATF